MTKAFSHRRLLLQQLTATTASKKSNATVVDEVISVAAVDVAMDFSEAVVDSEVTATVDEDVVVVEEEDPEEAAAQTSPK